LPGFVPGSRSSRVVGHDRAVIVGVGIDVVDVARFVATLERAPRLCARLFTDAEQQLPPSSLAARFAAKEALAKALGAPVGLHWRDAEVHRGADGRPHLEMYGTVAARAGELGVRSTHVSLSHDAGIASAVVVLEA
jgi:holo-[acyl-carrier protein] synthase